MNHVKIHWSLVILFGYKYLTFGVLKTLPMSNDKDSKDKSGKKSPAKNLKEKRSAKVAKHAEKSNQTST